MDVSKRNAFRRLIRRHARHARRDFPWRHTYDSYRILVSEVMLQQTQTDRVVPKYKEFLATFPTLSRLAMASPARVLHCWMGLGYNRRALALRALAREVVQQTGGILPEDPAVLEKLPGIGPYTAAAVAVFSRGARVPLIETNIRRVYLKHFFPRSAKVDDRKILKLVEETLPRGDLREWYYALMDYGAFLGRTEAVNPNRRSARYRVQSRFHGSDREIRGRILELLLANKKISEVTLMNFFPNPPEQIQKVIRALIKEGFLIRSKDILRVSPS